jgi:ribonuclease M5
MIVIVEGKNDYNKLKSIFPNMNIMITNGSAVSEEFLGIVSKLGKSNQIVLCLDPDYAGDKIRKMIQVVVPNASHIFASREKAISRNRKKVGIEHMTRNDIVELFRDIKVPNFQNNITSEDLYDLRLSGYDNSQTFRDILGKKLGIGSGNSKQFLKKLNMFNISLEEINKNI